jgi:hypothetical protein
MGFDGLLIDVQAAYNRFCAARCAICYEHGGGVGMQTKSMRQRSTCIGCAHPRLRYSHSLRKGFIVTFWAMSGKSRCELHMASSMSGWLLSKLDMIRPTFSGSIRRRVLKHTFIDRLNRQFQIKLLKLDRLACGKAFLLPSH